MIIKEEILVTMNAKNRVQTIKLQLDQNPISKIFSISRITSQYGGKETEQPVIQISKGKVKRTPAEQAALQYNSYLQNYMDKGYVKLSGLTKTAYKDLSEEDIIKLLGGGFVSDQSGIPKPMLAKLAEQCSPDIWNKELYCSTKLDGVRCMMYYKNGMVQTASRGGKGYNAATKHLREDPTLLAIFKQFPDLILDGELYKHDVNWPLQRISGVARLQEWTEECGNLEYWIYDYVSNEPFKDRYETLMTLQKMFPADSKIKVINHVKLTGYLNIKKEHDKYVQMGFEGLCARTGDKEYGVNKRSAFYLIKLKERKDGEFKITGVKEGLRPEDMCFTLVTKEGKEFSAKPIGSVEARLEYLANKDNFIGKMATCTYFAISSDGVPTQPVFQHVRPSDE